MLRVAAAVVLCVSLLACGAPPAPSAPPEQAAAEKVRQAIHEELRPVALANCDLQRFGGATDGGYLMCANLLEGAQSIYSYGIDKEDNWGCQLSTRLGVPVHQYDCFTEHRPACDGGQFVFHDECVGPIRREQDGRLFDSIEAQITANGDAGKTLLFKIDVEGAEVESFMATPDEALSRITQIPMEIHGTDIAVLEMIRKLKKTFHVVAVHANNWSCDPSLAPLNARAYQVLLVNKTVGTIDPNGKPHVPGAPPHAPDNPAAPECQPVFTAAAR